MKAEIIIARIEKLEYYAPKSPIECIPNQKADFHHNGIVVSLDGATNEVERFISYIKEQYMLA